MDELGAPARVVVRKVVRTTYRLEWEYDGCEYAGGEEGGFNPVRRSRVRTYFSRPAAYRAAALRFIFARRDKFATARDGHRLVDCRLCAAAPHGPEDLAQCRYHGGDGFETLVARLTIRLMRRDGVPIPPSVRRRARPGTKA